MRRLHAVWVVVVLGCGSPEPVSQDAASDGAALLDSAAGDGASAGDATAGDAASSSDASDGAVPSPGVAVFDGTSGYVEVPDADAFSQTTTGELTVEAWMRPDSLAMPSFEGTGYVHWMGKGTPDQHEWVSRMYQTGNSEMRANRISFYAFNPAGGLGAGSYFQDTFTAGTWIHYAGTFDATNITIVKNGVQRDTDLLSGYSIVPVNGTAPLRIGTRNMTSYFQGAITRVAIYDETLTATQLLAHYVARANGDYDAVILAEPSLVAYYKLDETSGTVAYDAFGSLDGTYVGGVTREDDTW